MSRLCANLFVFFTYVFSQLCFSSPVIGEIDVNFEVQTVNKISGTAYSKTSSQSLLFSASSSNESVEILFSFGQRKWTTHLNLELEEVSVSADGFTLTKENRSVLAASSVEVQRALPNDLRGYVHAMLLVQFLGYWSKSPEGYLIQNQKLGN